MKDVKPLGRKGEISPVVAIEIAKVKSLSLFVREHGPVVSEFRAARYRAVHRALWPRKASM